MKVEFLKVGHEGDDTLINDVSPWGRKWESSGSSAAFVDVSGRFDSPAGPMRSYIITVNGKTVHFWAGELEKGVWAFYR